MSYKKLDQFYTKDHIALKYFKILKKHVRLSKYDIILEPSAGKGAFYKLLPNDKRIGLDIVPKYKGIKKCDFFKYKYKANKKYLVIGNPPFGKNSSLAVSFFNHSAKFADIIAFIVPRTFKRVSIQNQLNLNFHLIYNDDLPLKPCCFEPQMSAKSSFQIWKKKKKRRKLVIYNKSHKDFKFLKKGPKNIFNQPTPPTNADFAMKAYGSNSGRITDKKLNQLTAKNWHWIKSNIGITKLKNRFKTLDYSISEDTVRQDSLGQQDLIYLYEQKYGAKNSSLI